MSACAKVNDHSNVKVNDKDCTNVKEDSETIVLRQPEQLLRQALGDELTVLDLRQSSLVPTGENYGSSMLKIDVVVKKRPDAAEERLALVAKMSPTAAVLQEWMNVKVSMPKEIYIFKKLIPTYRELQREVGIAEKDLIDVLPKYYGGRFSLDPDAHEVDFDAALLMENLKCIGYKSMDRKTGIDYAHAKKALSKLAEYHALGIALRIKRPKIFEEAREVIDIIPFDMNIELFANIGETIMQTVCNDSRMAIYKDLVQKQIDDNKNFECSYNMEAVEPWLTIHHGDFWVNNIMFKHDKEEPVDVKFVDFQLTYSCSPMKDLPYFLTASLSIETINNHFEDLIDIYHEKFIDTLKTLKCDTTPFLREEFDKQLRYDSSNQLYKCMAALKFFTMDTAENNIDLNDLKETVVQSKSNTTFIDRLCRMIEKFVEKEWL
ncbi:hypothetical protein TKK_0006734 [Trichogramma kaykai]|uniref:CHK kinase-like domain-containing protein n=1 Tax=Trichogramma kaykai TaxID=54128 RepID=A0ABD2XEF5_9HYME